MYMDAPCTVIHSGQEAGKLKCLQIDERINKIQNSFGHGAYQQNNQWQDSRALKTWKEPIREHILHCYIDLNILKKQIYGDRN